MKTLLAILILFTVSCSTVHISERKNSTTDKKLTNETVDFISGSYVNLRGGKDTSVERFSLWQKLFGNAKDFDKWQQAYVQLKIVGTDKLEALLFLDTTLIEKRTVTYKLTKGYLKLKRQYKAASMFGPIIWGAGTFQVYLGVTKDNQLTIINSHDGLAILIVLPFYVASNQDDNEYPKREL